MNYKDDIERLQRELQEAKSKQSRLENSCIHEWSETKYDPEEYQKASFSHYEGHGSDPNPIHNYYPAYKDRWSRTCKKCGKTQHTYEKQAVKYEPKF